MKRPILFAVLVLLVASGCTGGKDRRAVDAMPTTTNTALVPPTSTSVTASSEPPAVPRLERVLADLLQGRNEAFAAPDPAKADEYLSSDCTCYKPERDSLASLHDKGWRWESLMFEVRGIRIVKESAPDLVTLTVVASRPPERVIDGSGVLVKPQGPGLSPTGYSYVLARRDGTWKIVDNVQLQLDPAVLESIAAAGIPS